MGDGKIVWENLCRCFFIAQSAITLSMGNVSVGMMNEFYINTNNSHLCTA